MQFYSMDHQTYDAQLIQPSQNLTADMDFLLDLGFRLHLICASK